MTATPSLPTTSYAILGMLALRPWSAYELTQQMRRSLDYCWPRPESVLYQEPKRLVRLGLATAKQEVAGRRRRTVYTITEQGRGRLAEWLTTRPEPPRLEIETLLRLLYADQGQKDDLLQAIRAMRAWAAGHAPQGLWPVLNQGSPAILYCFLFLYFSAAGAGPWSIDALMSRRRRPVDFARSRSSHP